MAKKSNDSESADRPDGFEQSVQELERLVKTLENGELELEQSLVAYERAVGRLRACYEYLASAERRIELLKGLGAEGSVRSEPFEERPASLEEKQSQRSRRRSVD